MRVASPLSPHASVRRAIAEARAQEAPWLELMALLELCEHDGATAEDRQALAALVDQLPEAIDTTAVTRARALLDKAKLGLNDARVNGRLACRMGLVTRCCRPGTLGR